MKDCPTVAFDFRIDKILFSGAEGPITVGESDLIVLLGPNNAGKSAALREMRSYLQNLQAGVVIKVVTATRSGDEDEFVEWLFEVASLMPPADEAVAGWNAEMHFGNAKIQWGNAANGLENLTNFLTLLVNAETRLQLASSVESFDSRLNVPRQPLQRLLVDPEAERRLAQAVRTAFGTTVSVDRAGGSAIHLMLGEAAGEPRLDNKAYIDEVKDLPLVSEQGDGVRSFVGLMLALEAAPYPIVFIDEPEAFLHPPQAREIGRQLASRSSAQRFVATHDSDVLLGMLDRASSPLIIRLRREGDTNVPAVLDRDRVKELWQDPSFRYSRLLDGLFHRGAVICEADGDATIYAAALDAELEERGEPSSDYLFTQCGGKHKMAAAVRALRPMGVPVASVVDFDALRDQRVIEDIVTALGGSWTNYVGKWNSVRSAIDSLAVEAAAIGDIEDEISATLGGDRTARLSEQQSRRIREITKRIDGWKQVKKRGGIAAIPHGTARAAADELVAEFESIGLFLVPVGELEGWAPAIGNHGPEFVDEALTKGIHKDNEDLRAFVFKAAQFLAA